MCVVLYKKRETPVKTSLHNNKELSTYYLPNDFAKPSGVSSEADNQ